MSSFSRLRAEHPGPEVPLKVLAASGQLGYGIPEKAFREGMSRKLDVIGCDMGSIDVGPYYLGSSNLATSEAITMRDLGLVLNAAVSTRTPLLIGSAGTAGARPHLEKTLSMVRRIAQRDGLKFRLAVVLSDVPRDILHKMVGAGRTRAIASMPDLEPGVIDSASQIVGQMGTEAFIRAIEKEPDVIIAGRACDTAVFSAVPQILGYDLGIATHMAKIIECTSICCVPGGRDAMLGTLAAESFVLESMNPDRAATPLSVAAHTLYEQADPLTVHEPEGNLHVHQSKFEALDDRRTCVRGARWEPATQNTIKVEGAEYIGERAIFGAGSCDPKVITNSESIVAGVRGNVSDIMGVDLDDKYDLHFHVYGKGATGLFPASPKQEPPEVYFLAECIAETTDLAKAVVGVTKQYLLHHGFEGRLSTGGNIAFAFTPPEIQAGSAYRFSLYHICDCDDLEAVFPVRIEEIGTKDARRTETAS